MSQSDVRDDFRGPECPSREILSGLALGTLPIETFDAAAEHVTACPTCQAYLDTLDDSADPLVRGLRGTPHVDSLALPAVLQRQIALAERIAESQWATERGEATEVISKSASPGSGAVEPQSFGQYELLQQIGAGGMGTVWKARHLRLRRHVAIKFLPKDRVRDPQAIARFEREMAAVGVLDHPHLVRAHDAGEIEGQPFLVMEYVEGMDLSTLGSRLGRLPIAEACEMIRQAAIGLQYAYEHGLVHRDIKPSNLMLTQGSRQTPSAAADGTRSVPATVKILDLGLALLEIPETAHGELTSSGQAMGTADYISPEQAADSHSVDIRADIYSLGCTLYKLLTGKSPFAGPKYKTAMQKMVGHLSSEVPPIQGLRPEVSDELAAIVHRMLAKSPEDRPATPAEVAAALEVFAQKADLHRLYAEAIGERNPAPADLAEIDTQPHLSSASADTASRGKPAGEVEIEPGAAQSPAQPESLSQGFRSLEDFGSLRGFGTGSKAATRRYLPWLGAGIALALFGGGLYFGITILLKDDKNKVVAEITVPNAVTAEIVPQGKAPTKEAAKAGTSNAWKPGPAEDVLPGIIPRPAKIPGIHRWQVATAERAGSMPRAILWSPDNQFLLLNEDNLVRVFDTETLAPVRLLVGGAGLVQAMAWCHGGEWLVTGDSQGIVRLWKIDGALVRSFKLSMGIESLVVSPDGEHLAVGLEFPAAPQLVDLQGKSQGPLEGARLAGPWSPDGRRIAARLDDDRVRLFSASDGRRGVVLDSPAENGYFGWILSGEVRDLAWHPKGEWLACIIPDGKVRLWKPDGSSGPTLDGHSGGTRALAWSLDGSWLATSGEDKAIRLWKSDGQAGPVLEGHSTRVVTLAWSPDSQCLASSSYHSDETRIWQLAPQLKCTAFPDAIGHGLAWSPDSKRVAFRGRHRENPVAGWVSLGGSRNSLNGCTTAALAEIAWSPDDAKLACGSWDGIVTLWDSKGRPMAQQRYGKDRWLRTGANNLDWHPDARQLAVGAWDGVHVWDTEASPEHADKKLEPAAVSNPQGSRPVAWSPDGKLLVSSGEAEPIGSAHYGRIWDDAGSLVKSIEGCGAQGIAWSPDGATFFTASDNQTISLRNRDGTLVSAFHNASALVMSPLGNYLAVNNVERVELVTTDGKAVLVVREPQYVYFRPAWSPDGQRFAARAREAGIGIWNLDGAPGASLKSSALDVRGLSWSRSGRRLASSSHSGVIRSWDLDLGYPEWSALLFADGTSVTFSPAGQILHGDPAVLEKQLVYAVQRTSDGPQELWTYRQFQGLVAKAGMGPMLRISELESEKANPKLETQAPLPALPTDPDRRVADRVLAAGGVVTISMASSSAEQEIRRADALPRQPFHVRSVNVARSAFADADVEALSDVHWLDRLDLWNCRQISDNAMVYVGKLRELQELCVEATLVTDAGLAKIAHLPELTSCQIVTLRSARAARHR